MLRTFYKCYTYKLRPQHFECDGSTFKYAGRNDRRARNKYSSVICPFLTPVSTCPNYPAQSLSSKFIFAKTIQTVILSFFVKIVAQIIEILGKTAKSFQLPPAPVLLYNTYFRENFFLGGGAGVSQKNSQN
jgi:hypothetical protein